MLPLPLFCPLCFESNAVNDAVLRGLITLECCKKSSWQDMIQFISESTRAVKLIALNIQIPVWLEPIFYALLTPCVVWSTMCSSSAVWHSYLISWWDIFLLGDTWVTKLPIERTGVPGESVSVLAALRFWTQSLLSSTPRMEATEARNSERKHSTEPPYLSSRTILIYKALSP